MSITKPSEKSQEAMQAKTQAIPPRVREEVSPLPSGGTEGQVLTMGETEAEWKDLPQELPEGGTAGQVLTLEVPEGETDPVPAWADAPSSGVKTGATNNRFILSVSNAEPAALGKKSASSLSTSPSGTVTTAKAHAQNEITEVLFCANAQFIQTCNVVAYRHAYTPTTAGSITFGNTSFMVEGTASVKKDSTAVGTFKVLCEYSTSYDSVKISLIRGYIKWNADAPADTYQLEASEHIYGPVLVAGYDADGKLCEGTVLADNGTWGTVTNPTLYVTALE